MRDNNKHGLVGGEGKERKVFRRIVLRGAGAAGVMGTFSGCLGTVKREYEATPASVPAETAREHGFEAEPQVDRQTASFSRRVGVADVETEMTGYIYRYEHEGSPAAETEGGGGSETTPTETPTETPTQTPIDTTPPDDDDGDEPATTPIDTTPKPSTPTRTPTQTPIDTTPKPSTPTRTPTTPEGTGPGIREVEPDILNITTTPNPSFVGLDLNPAASKSIENLIETETAAFEQACGCNIESPGKVEVQSTSAPTETQISSADVGRTVFSIDPASRSLDVPEAVELMGEQRPLGYFAFTTPTESGDGVAANLVVTAKGTGQMGGGTNEAVVASYFSKAGGAGGIIPEQEFSVIAPEGAGPGLFTPGQLETAAGRFTPVCPELTPTGNGTGPGTVTGTGTGTPPPADPCEEYRTLIAKRQEALSRLAQRRTELRAAKMRYEANWYAKWLRAKAEQVLDRQNPDTQTVEAASRVLKNTQPVADLTQADMNELARRVQTRLNRVDSAVQEYASINQRIVGLEFVPPLEGPPSSVIEYPEGDPCSSPTTPEGETVTPTSTPTETATETPTSTPTETPPPPCEEQKECLQAVICIRAYRGKTRLGTAKGNVEKTASFNMDWGHAWVQVKRTFLHRCGDRDQIKREVYGAGLYPAGAAWKAGTVGTEGDVSENTSTGFDCEYCERIPCEAATNLVNRMQKRENYTKDDPKSEKPPDYHAATYNCVDWALDMFDRVTGNASKVNPGPGGPLGDGGGVIADATIDTPTEPCEQIKEVQGAYIQ